MVPVVRTEAMAETLAAYRRPLWRLFWRARSFTAKGPGYVLANLRWRARGMAEPLGRVLPASQAKAGVGTSLPEARSLASHFRTRVDPPFHFDEPEAIVPLVDSAVRGTTIALAGDILHGVFRFRGVEARMDPIHWDCCPHGNSDWTRDLNRHFYLVSLGMAHNYTGDAIYAAGFARTVGDWLDRNGPGSAAWSCPFEVAARLNAWIWSLYLFRNAPSFSDEQLAAFTDGLRRQARHLAANLEYHIPTNHLLLEAKTLALCGLLFPEWEEAGGWFRKGLSVLSAEIARQVCPDGVHGERSILYHKIITSELSELLWLLRRRDREIPGPLSDAYCRMLEFELCITRPDGTFPLFSDSAIADGYLRFSALAIGSLIFGRPDFARGNPDLTESTIWLLGERALEEYRTMARGNASMVSRGFPDGGYFVMRDVRKGLSQYMAVDCGPFGLPLVPDHGHADALSFELSTEGRSLIVDSGVYGYNLGEEWRAYFRGTRAHNTLVVDGKDQSLLDGVRHVYRPARARLHNWFPGRHFDWLDGSHDGYCRLPGAIEHRRQILFTKGEYWVVADWALGQGSHSYDILFHLPPGSSPVVRNGVVRTGDGRSPGLAILPFYPSESEHHIVEGEKDPIQGWVSFESGTAIPAPAIDYRMSGPAPARFAAVLFPLYEDAGLPAVTGHTWPAPDERMVIAGSLSFGGWTDHLVLSMDAPGDPGLGPLYSDGRAGFLRWEEGKGRLGRALLIGGSRLAYTSVPIVRASCSLEMLELALEGEELNIQVDSSRGCDLTILMPSSVTVTLNGRPSGFTRDGSFINVSSLPDSRGSAGTET